MPSHRKFPRNLAQHEKLKIVVENLRIAGRIVNMVALRQQLEFGNLKLNTVVRELLNYSESLDPDSLAKAGVPGLSDELAKLVSVVKTECAVKGEPCSGLEVVVDGGKALMGMQPLPPNIGEYFKKGGPLQTLGQVKTNYDVIIVLKTSAVEFQTHCITALDAKSKNDNSWYLEVQLAYAELLKIVKVVNSFSKLTDEQLQAFDEKTAIVSIDAVINLLEVFSDKNIALNALEDKLGLLNNALSKFKSPFSRGAANDILSKVQLLLEASGARKLSMSKKKSTHGFPNGAKDLEQLPLDLKTSFVKNSLTDEEGFEVVKSLEKFFSDLYKELQGVLENRKSLNGQQLIHHVKMIKKTMDSAVIDVESLLAAVPKLYEHVKKLNGVVKSLKKINWAEEKESLQKLQNNEMKAFSTQTNQASFSSTALLSLHKALEAGAKNVVKAWEEFKQFDAVKTELNEMIAQMKTVDESHIKKWAQSTEIKSIGSDPLFQETEINSALTFLGDKKDVKTVVDALDGQNSLTNILAITDTNKSIAGVMSAATASKTVATKYSDLEKKLSSKEISPFKKTESMKGIDLKVSKDFNEYAISLHNLLKFHESAAKINNLEKLLGGAQNQAWVSKLSLDAKKEYDKLLGLETKKQIAELVKSGGMLDKSVTEVPRNISGYTNAIKVGFDFPGNIDIDMQMAAEFMLDHQASQPLLQAINDVRDLEMSFVSGQRQRGLQSFLTSLTFLLGLSASATIGNSSSLSDLGTTSATVSTGLLVGGIGGGVLVVGLIAGGVGYYFWREKNKSSTPDVPPQGILSKEDAQYADVEIRTDKNGNQAIVVVPKNVQDACSTNSFFHEERIIKKDDRTKTVASEKVLTKKNVRREQLNQVLDAIRAQIALEKQHAQPSANQEPMKINTPTPAFLRALAKVEFSNEYVETTNEVVWNVSRCDYKCGSTIDTYRKLGNDAEATLDSSTRTARPEVSNRVLDVREKKDLENSMELSAKVNAKVNVLVEEKIKEEEKNRKASGKDSWIPRLTCCQKSDTDSGSDNDERADAGSDEEEPMRRETTLEKYNRSPETLLMYLNDPLLPTDVVEDTANFDNSGVFYEYSIRTPSKRINYYSILNGLMSPKILDVKQWPHETAEGVYGYHMPLNTCLQIVNDLENLLSLEDPCLHINRKMHKVCGDIHGKPRDLAYQFSLVLEEQEASLLMLGDLVDRGPKSIDVIMMVAALKKINRGKIHILRGNHEFPNTNGQYGFLKECKRTFGDVGGKKFFCAVNKMFKMLPRVAILQKAFFCVHGGLTKEMLLGMVVYLSKLKKIPITEEEMNILLNHEWGDPVDEHGIFKNKYEKCVYNCSNYTIVEILKRLGLKVVIRAHQVVKYGYKFFAGTWGVTIFGSTNNENNNWACQLTITQDLKVEIDRFVNNVDFKGPAHEELTMREIRQRNKNGEQ